MTRYVPVIAVAPEGIADRISKWANDPVALAALEPVAELMGRNGWTPEMVMAGVVLAFGVEHGAVEATR